MAEFKVEVSHWDDGNYGRSIRDNAKGCGAESLVEI